MVAQPRLPPALCSMHLPLGRILVSLKLLSLELLLFGPEGGISGLCPCGQREQLPAWWAIFQRLVKGLISPHISEEELPASIIPLFSAMVVIAQRRSLLK